MVADVHRNLTGVAYHQDQGARDYQEDSFGVREVGKSYLLALADGMGGHVGGAQASNIAVKSTLIFEDVDDQELNAEFLSSKIETANTDIAKALEEKPELNGMGTTLVLLSVSEAGYLFSSVGDSPLWIFRDGELVRMNADHSMAPVLEDLVEAGRMTKEEAAKDSRKNALRSALTGEDIDLLDVSDAIIKAQAGDLLLLASDGVETLNNSQIVDILNKSKLDAEIAAKSLVQGVLAESRDNQDNVSVMVVSYDMLFNNNDKSKASETDLVDLNDAEDSVTQPLRRPGLNKQVEPRDSINQSKTKKGLGRFLVLFLLLALSLGVYLYVSGRFDELIKGGAS